MKKNQLIGHPVQLHEVIIEKFECNRYHHSLNPINEVEINISASIDSKVIDVNTAYAFLTINIETKSEPKMLDITLVLRGTCVVEVKEEIDLEGFIDANALPLLLPWAREIVSSTTVKMGFPPIMLPTINVLQTLKANQNEETDCGE